MAQIEACTATVQIGRIYDGRVTSIKDFGAFVEILPGQDGLCHISELSDGFVSSVADVCKVGDEMKVKVIAIDDQDRVKLSRRRALEELGIVDELASRTGDEEPGREEQPREGGRDHGRDGRWSGDRERGDRGGGGAAGMRDTVAEADEAGRRRPAGVVAHAGRQQPVRRRKYEPNYVPKQKQAGFPCREACLFAFSSRWKCRS